MKTQILHLETHDDIISARDKMGWGKTGRILLVWPQRGRVLTRRLDLVLLQRHSTSLGAQLALVTGDPEVRTYAAELGIPIFSSLRKAQSAHWRVPRHARRPRQPLPAPGGETRFRPEEWRFASPRPHPAMLALPLRLGLFTLGVLALLAIAAVLVPSAQIRLAPAIQEQEIAFEVQADPQAGVFNLAGTVPARAIPVTVEGRDFLTTTGSIQIPDQPASGKVRLTNLTNTPVTVPAGSVIISQGLPLEFATLKEASLPAGPGQALTITVEALAPGPASNLPAGSLAAMEGILGTQVAVTNTQALRGGSDQLGRAPSAADREKLSARLREALRQTALKELEGGLEPGDILLASTLALVEVQEEAFLPAASQPADQLSLSLRLEFNALVVTAKDLNALAEAVLDANRPAGFLPTPGSLSVENHPPGPGGALTHWQVSARRSLQAEFSPAQAVQAVLGRSPALAQQNLAQALPLQYPPEITLTPPGWPRLPFLPFRITVMRK